MVQRPSGRSLLDNPCRLGESQLRATYHRVEVRGSIWRCSSSARGARSVSMMSPLQSNCVWRSSVRASRLNPEVEVRHLALVSVPIVRPALQSNQSNPKPIQESAYRGTSIPGRYFRYGRLRGYFFPQKRRSGRVYPSYCPAREFRRPRRQRVLVWRLPLWAEPVSAGQRVRAKSKAFCIMREFRDLVKLSIFAALLGAEGQRSC